MPVHLRLLPDWVSDPRIPFAWKALVTAYLVLAAGWSVVGTGVHQNATLLSHLPLRLHFGVEEGLDEGLYSLVTGYTAREFTSLLRIRGLTIQNHGVFDDDNITVYEREDPRGFGPPWFGPSWPGDLYPSFLAKQEYDLWVAFLKGRGKEHAGISDFAQRIGIMANASSGFFYGVWTLWHELGHAAGLAHRHDSPIMSYGRGWIFDYLGRGVMWPRGDIATALENHTLRELEGASLAWLPGEPYVYGDNFTSPAYVTKDWQHVFWRSSDNWIISLTLRQQYEVWNGTERKTATLLYRIDMPPTFLLNVFAPSEMQFLKRAQGGFGAIPPPPTHPDAKNNSTGQYWIRVGLNTALDPVFLLGFGLIVWRVSRIMFARDLCRPREECDDGLILRNRHAAAFLRR